MSTDVELETRVVHDIQSGIEQGRILQDQKSLYLKGKHGGLLKQPRLAKYEMRNRSKSKNNKKVSKSPIVKTIRSSAVRGYGSSHKARVAKSVFLYNSMRISELAAPSKRQCLESWRANANILPAIMIHRLQQRIMDKEPVVKVSDVVTYSKHNKRPKRNTQEKVIVLENIRPTSSRRENNNIIEAKYKTIKTRRQDNQDLIDVLEKKIAELLMRPMHISLNSELQKVNSIINHELYNIIKENKTFRTDNVTKPLLSEISEKVTIWIAKILEDSAEKLLLEDLEDLEETEGPVLDILDDILDSILRKCIRTPSVTSEFVSVSSGDTDDIGNDEEGSKTGTLKEEVDDTIEDDITKRINRLIDSLQHDDFIDIPIRDEKVETIASVNDELKESTQIEENLKNVDNDIAKQIDKITGLSNTEDVLDMSPNFSADHLVLAAESHDVHLIYNNKAFEDERQVEDQNSSDTRDLNELEATEDQVEQGRENNSTIPFAEDDVAISTARDQNIENTNLKDDTPLSHKNSVTSNILENPIVEEQTSNVSAAIEVVTEELPEEKREKLKLKLKESIDVMLIKANEQHPLNRDILESSGVHFTGNLNKPNEHLLSDADELWPPRVTTAKPSAIILTQALSMGKILEADEKYSISLHEPTESLTQYTETSYPNPKTIQDKNELSPQNKENIDESSDNGNEEHSLQNMICETKNIEESLENCDKYNTGKTLHKDFENKVRDEKPNSIQNIQGTCEIRIEMNNGYSTQNIDRTGEYGDGERTEYSSQNSGKKTHKENNNDLSHKDEREHDLEYISKHFYQETNEYNSIAELSTEGVQQDAIKISNKTVQGSGINPKKGQVQKYVNKLDQTQLVLAEITPRKKFDYRVHINTAPSWIRVGEGEPSGGSCACRPVHYPGMNSMIERDQELQKWCQNLDYTLVNIHKWTDMLNYISKYITTLKQKTETKYVITQNKLASNNRNDTWSGLNKHENKHFQLRRRDDAVKFKISFSPVRSCGRCGRLLPNQIEKKHHRSPSRRRLGTMCKRHRHH